MNKDQVYGLLRTLVVIAMTYLTSSGILTPEQAPVLLHAFTEGLPMVIAAGVMVYGAWRKRDAAKVVDAGKVKGVVAVVDPNKADIAVVNAALKAPDEEVKVGKI